MSLPPGSMGPPVVGQTLEFVRDPYRFLERRHRRYGDVFRSAIFGRKVVFLSGVDGADAFYDDSLISRQDAHPFPLVSLFGGENMEMFDGDRHLALKTVALQAFDAAAIERYLPDLQTRMEERLRRLSERDEFVAARELQRVAIEAIWTSVMGPPAAGEAQEITRDYERVLHGLTSIPLALPGTPYARSRQARDRLLERIRGEVAARRSEPRNDGLSTMLQAAAPDGARMTDDEAVLEVHHVVIAGFIVYLLMVEVLRRLAESPELRDGCAEEVARVTPDGSITATALAALETCTHVVMETKRFVPLVPLAFGRAKRSFSFDGHDVPAGWTVYLALHLNNHDGRIFHEPDAFDPDRFSDGRREGLAHARAFIPQGAEPPTGHRCLGVEYSTAMVLTFMVVLLRSYRWTLPPQDLSRNPKLIPPEPRDGLRVILHPSG